MPIDKERLTAMLRRVAALWRENAAHLGEMDSRFGDGDHGVTAEKIANLLDASLDAWGGQSIKTFLRKLGEGIMAVGGGSAGPLYGTLVSGLAEPLADEDAALDADALKQALASAAAELRGITKADVGDKTMMDAILPAAAAAAVGDDIAGILADAADAAGRGAEATRNFAAKYGRAKNYGERSIGAPDVGAVSAALLFQGLSEGFSADLLA